MVTMLFKIGDNADSFWHLNKAMLPMLDMLVTGVEGDSALPYVLVIG